MAAHPVSSSSLLVQTYPTGGIEDRCLLDEWYRQRNVRRFPWRGLILAVALLLVGSLLTIVGILLLCGFVRLEAFDEKTPYGLLILGALCILPGAYHVLLALRISAGNRRLNWDDIPDFD